MRLSEPEFGMVRLAAAVVVLTTATCSVAFGAEGAGEKQEDAVLKNTVLKGYCPVSYFLKGKAAKGDPKYTSTYCGEEYRFASPELKKKFDADPEKYVPRLGGLCAMALGGPYANRFQADPKVFKVINSKLYLFGSERARNAYQANPEGVLESAEELFSVPYLRGYCPVSYQSGKKVLDGDRKYPVVYHRELYYLSSAEAKAKFVKNPERYVPMYHMYCARSLAKNRFHPADLKLFSVVGDRTYLFSSRKTKTEFDHDPKGTIERADKIWGQMKKK